MTVSEFQDLDYHGRLKAIHAGVFIAGRETAEQHLLLYQLHEFYFELHYHKERNFICDLSTFKDVNRLEPYWR